tara:strand:+ start:1687 stop:1914 length:228 start_codon:yes stop_codon:yes gene_type:complete
MPDLLKKKLQRLLQLLYQEYYRQETLDERNQVKFEIEQVKRDLKQLQSEVVDARLTAQWEHLLRLDEQKDKYIEK